MLTVLCLYHFHAYLLLVGVSSLPTTRTCASSLAACPLAVRTCFACMHGKPKEHEDLCLASTVPILCLIGGEDKYSGFFGGFMSCFHSPYPMPDWRRGQTLWLLWNWSWLDSCGMWLCTTFTAFPVSLSSVSILLLDLLLFLVPLPWWFFLETVPAKSLSHRFLSQALCLGTQPKPPLPVYCL